MTRHFSHFAGLALLLSACGLPQVHQDFHGLPPETDPKAFTCCHDMERWPEPNVSVSLAAAPKVLDNNPLDAAEVRPGLLSANAEAHAHIVAQARPLDLVLLANKSYIGGRFVPGRFTHSAIYLGSEAELRASGQWNDPAIRPLHEKIRAGGRFVEAVHPIVKLARPDELFQVDAVALIRPELSAGQRRAAARSAVSTLGVPFDYYFDNSTPEALACTEVIPNAMPALGLRERLSYGRPAVVPDDLVAQAIRGERMRLVEHVRGTKDGGFVVEGARRAMVDIAAFRGPPFEL